MVAPMLPSLGLTRNVTLLGQVAQPSLAIRQADILVSIDADDKDPVFLPSKLLDYLSTDRVVLSISPRGSPAETMLGLVPKSSVQSSHDLVAIANAMEKASQITWTAALDLERREALANFTSACLGNKAVSFLQQIAQRQSFSK